jgi:hypothetical protein
MELTGVMVNAEQTVRTTLPNDGLFGKKDYR